MDLISGAACVAYSRCKFWNQLCKLEKTIVLRWHLPWMPSSCWDTNLRECSYFFEAQKTNSHTPGFAWLGDRLFEVFASHALLVELVRIGLVAKRTACQLVYVCQSMFAPANLNNCAAGLWWYCYVTATTSVWQNKCSSKCMYIHIWPTLLFLRLAVLCLHLILPSPWELFQNHQPESS